MRGFLNLDSFRNADRKYPEIRHKIAFNVLRPLNGYIKIAEIIHAPIYRAVYTGVGEIPGVGRIDMFSLDGVQLEAAKQQADIERVVTFSWSPVLNEPQRPRVDILRRLCRMTAATSALSVLLEDDFSSVSPVAVRVKNTDVVEVAPGASMGDFNLLARDNPMTLPFLKRFVAGMMAPIALARRELVDDFHWYSSNYVSQHRLGRGVDDCLFSAIDLPGRKPFLELVCLNRSSMNRRAFTARDGQSVRTAHIAYSAIDRTDPEDFLADADARARTPDRGIDPAAEMQKVLEHALRGETEEQLCLSAGVDRARLDQHLKTILAEFNVGSLADLTARWGKRRRLQN